MVSINHGGAHASVREPPRCCPVHPGNRRQFMADGFDLISGYRTPYPDVEVATSRRGARRGPALKAGHGRSYRYNAATN